MRLDIMLVASCALASPTLARAQDLPRDRFADAGLTGEAQVSGSQATGNTRASDFGAGGRLEFEGVNWRHSASGQFDFASADGQQTRNRIFAGSNGDLLFSDRVFGFSNGSYERDAFSGFEFRGVLSAGVGADLYRRDRRRWTVRGGPGVRVERSRAELLDETGLLDDADTVVTWVARAESEFEQKLSEHAEITNRTVVVPGQDSTNFNNVTELTAQIGGPFSLRLSFQVSHETRPPAGAVQTDTISRAALVFRFGDGKNRFRQP